MVPVLRLEMGLARETCARVRMTRRDAMALVVVDLMNGILAID
jgi:hypothetical protein